MRTPLILGLVALMVLAGCGTRLNPFNWFGRSYEVPAEQVQQEAVNPLIPRRAGGLFGQSRREFREQDITTPIATVTDLRIERVPGGAIIRVTGLDATQGAYNVELVPTTEDEIPVDGVLSYTLERALPERRQRVGPEQTREVVAGRALTDQQLAGVRRIRVEAAQNAREASR